MTNSKDGALRQMGMGETDDLANEVASTHKVRVVPSGFGSPVFACPCGETFPVSGDAVRQHLYDRIGEAAEATGKVPHPSWGGFAKPEADAPEVPGAPPISTLGESGLPRERQYAGEVADWCQRELDAARGGSAPMGRAYVQNVLLIIEALREYAKPDAPAGSPDWTGLGADKSAQAMALIADLTALLKADSFPVAAETAVLARAEAFLQHGDEAFREVDPGPAIGGAFEERPISLTAAVLALTAAGLRVTLRKDDR